jgi:SAM-dependent methyltransferase
VLTRRLHTFVYGLLKLILRKSERERRRFSLKYLKGDGIEIGALHLPLKIYSGARVKYVDRFSVSDLRQHYPELSKRELVDVDILDDGEKLDSIADGTLDFVLANQVIEHTEDPISSVSNWLRVLRRGGSLYLSIPNKDKTFDSKRPLTRIEHILKDYISGPEQSRKAHYVEWVNLVLNKTEAESDHVAQELLDMKYSIHFHVWNPDTFKDFLRVCFHTLNTKTEILEFKVVGREIIVVIRKL